MSNVTTASFGRHTVDLSARYATLVELPDGQGWIGMSQDMDADCPIEWLESCDGEVLLLNCGHSSTLPHVDDSRFDRGGYYADAADIARRWVGIYGPDAGEIRMHHGYSQGDWWEILYTKYTNDVADALEAWLLGDVWVMDLIGPDGELLDSLGSTYVDAYDDEAVIAEARNQFGI